MDKFNEIYERIIAECNNKFLNKNVIKEQTKFDYSSLPAFSCDLDCVFDSKKDRRDFVKTAAEYNVKVHIYNCHPNTDSFDIEGNLGDMIAFLKHARYFNESGDSEYAFRSTLEIDKDVEYDPEGLEQYLDEELGEDSRG